MKEQPADSSGGGASGRCSAFLIRYFLVLLGAVCVVALAFNLLRETKDYIEERRLPVMLPTGGAKF